MFVTIDRVSKCASAELHPRATRAVAAEFLGRLIQAMPYKIHTVLTYNGTQFTTPGNTHSAAGEIKVAVAAGEVFRAHAYEYACAKADGWTTPDGIAMPSR